MNQKMKANDIDLKMIEFFNLNADFYEETSQLQHRDYFTHEVDTHKEDSSNGKMQAESLGTSAHDLLEMKRKL
jgi:hypothetical protein